MLANTHFWIHPTSLIAAALYVQVLPRGSMQIELLDRRSTRAELANAMFEWIEAFYNPVRRHSGLGYRSRVEFERLHKTANPAA